eukprot:SRR837773.9307.p1 GENE.SRR837773.9307~~SRR837773.9307.p1  ORF type:complete len:307 (-),score=101.04 SRR837773.9307:123-1043(-)
MASCAYAITMCDCAENASSPGNVKLGQRLKKGLCVADLEKIRDALVKKDASLQPRIVALRTAAQLAGEQLDAAPVAHVLHCPGGVRGLGSAAEVLFAEMRSKPMDDRVISYGREVTRHRRKNCLIGAEHQDGHTWQDESGRNFRRPLTYSWEEMPAMRQAHRAITKILGKTSIAGAPIHAEVNLYEYGAAKSDITQGIGYHADNERKVVFALNLADDGCERFLEFQYFERFRPVGRAVRFALKQGDLYVMDEAATGSTRLKHRAGKDESFAKEDASNKRKWEKKDAEKGAKRPSAASSGSRRSAGA